MEAWEVHHHGPRHKAWEEYWKAVEKERRVTHAKLIEALRCYVESFSDGFKGAHLFRWIRDDRWEEQEGKSSGGARPKGNVQPGQWVDGTPVARWL